ncbi:hypothetical protein I6A84_31860 [Frankia sp. CNm7]|uniref:Uncharacterized protein n=1 Tax=Frankia nepalensis TaxID=1836974 RepID=A0A937UVF2_9ACTN|nr:hypothetical protein [Frankia nepalensis]MBL7499275.1 hypothetical protein [Frankia nepalensis]MBL7512377.1 hypothetical protein [Frankia nepalensis]MBL7522560.1 hypothetical protein [Frankia nepalensis]MBL7632191.1 hypothetical protein [Frankia nepalensis]
MAAEATRKALLTCELTDILTLVVTSHWNRLGVAAATRAALAQAAANVYLRQD